MKYLCMLLLLISCANYMPNQQTQSRNQFRKFIKRQKIIKLPVRIELYKDYNDLTEPLDTDTAIFHDPVRMGCLGVLEDTSRFYYVISMYPGDDLYPILNVFDKNGDLVESAGLLIGKYGTDCGVYVYGFTEIRKDLSIFTQDSLVEYPCDSVGNENRKSKTIYLNSKEIKVLRNGRVKQGPEIERIIKN